MNGALFTTFAGVAAAACFARGLAFRGTSHLSELAWYSGGVVVLLAAALAWTQLEQHVGRLQWAVVASLALMFAGLIALTSFEWYRPTSQTEATTHIVQQQPIVGHTIEGRGQGGVAEEIVSNGSPKGPTTGAEINVHGLPGQSLTGVKVIQSGPGTGLRVIQNGPGTGMRIKVGP